MDLESMLHPAATAGEFTCSPKTSATRRTENLMSHVTASVVGQVANLPYIS